MSETDMEAISGDRVLELFWPMNDMFRARLPSIRKLRYNSRFEEEADRAILMLRTGEADWSDLTSGAWRVLLERHQQLLALAAMHEVTGRPVVFIPRGLDEDEQRVALAETLLLRMELPLPAADLSALELPSGPPKRAH